MAYMKINWENYPSQATPIDEDNLNHMEDGIEEAVTGLDLKVDKTDYDAFIEQLLPVDTEAGNPAVITDAFGGSVKALSVTFEPTQSGSGTPSPGNVRPISGLTEASLKRTGKNQLSLVDETKVQNGVTITPIKENGVVVGYDLDGTATGNFDFWIATGQGLAAGYNKYVTTGLSVEKTGFQIVIAPSYTGVKTSIVLSLEIRGAYLNISAGTSFSHMVVKPMICPNEIEDKTFEPYTGETYTIDLDGTRYGGVLDVKMGVLTVTHQIIDLGSLSWVASANDYGFTASSSAISGAVNPINNGTKADMICSDYIVLPYYVNGQSGVDANSTDGSLGIWVSGGMLNGVVCPQRSVFIRDANLGNKSSADIKTALTGVTICYKLATPITVQLTPDEVTLLKGDNVLTTDADSIEASYSADIALYIDKKIAEGSASRSVDTSSLTKSGSTESTEEATKTVESEDK